MSINMRRRDYSSQNQCEHTGLLLDRGFENWHPDNHNTDIGKLHQKASETKAPELYTKAYERWNKTLLSNTETSQIWHGKLDNRMYIGMGEASPLEAAISLHHSYGVPFIPGSAIKGVIHHYALELLDKETDKHLINTLFGREPEKNQPRDSGEAGYIIFNDAWWMPESAQTPLIPEIITAHHPDYYSKKGKVSATDFDSPNPNPQIAVRGSFLFSVEGEQSWAKYAIKLLTQAMQHKGAGAKGTSGYGYFNEETEPYKTEEQKQQDKIETWETAIIKKDNIRGLGDAIVATYNGEKAQARQQDLQLDIEQLSKNKQKKMKNGIQQSITVEKIGNSYKITQLNFP